MDVNKEASNWIYLENLGSDLHGLYVKEAIAYTDAALKEAKLRGDSEIRLIVAKVGPAIKNLMRKYQLVAES
ncbi:hypothetical protein EV421DRAFT_1867864 [Armillaria borealis]|uniref:Uncharacterized protein n=1 Tax=Armillaria borealis TaxID=47425 RepID=A0AA39M523_9AGAR|nr:hypothetical protein EV421DRAFT_1867864 [Armillaria borealis]